MTRLSREESQEVTRQKLIQAARDQIARQGVAAASIRDIAEAAGYSQGAIYSNFASKEALLLEVMRDHLTGVIARFEQMADSVCGVPVEPGDMGAALAAAGGYFSNLAPRSNWSTLAVELQLHANRSGAFADDYGAMRTAFQQRIGAALGRIFDHLGLRPPLSPEDFAMGLVSTSIGFAIQGDAASYEARGRYMSAMFRALLETAERTDRSP